MPNPKATSLDDALTAVTSKSSLDDALAKVTAPQQDTRTFGQRVADAAVDMPIGMIKNAGRMVQAIPGVTAATDALYGLPKGASAQAMQPSNTNQRVGGYLGDVALAAATAGAEVGGPILSRTAGYISNPTVAERAAAAASGPAQLAGDTITAIKAKLAAGGPVTPDKVASLVVKYGKDAVRAAVVAGGGYGAWQAVKHLLI